MKVSRIVLIRGLIAAITLLIVLVIVKDRFDWAVVAGAIVAGLVTMIFAHFESRFLKRIGERLAFRVPAVELQANENVLLSDGASLYSGRQAIGGKLILTNHRLVFKPHGFNFKRIEKEFPLSHVREVRKDKNVMNHDVLVIQSTDETIDRFLLKDVTPWVAAIRL